MFVLYTDNSNYRNFLYDIYLFTSHNFYITQIWILCHTREAHIVAHTVKRMM